MDSKQSTHLQARWGTKAASATSSDHRIARFVASAEATQRASATNCSSDKSCALASGLSPASTRAAPTCAASKPTRSVFLIILRREANAVLTCAVAHHRSPQAVDFVLLAKSVYTVNATVSTRSTYRRLTALFRRPRAMAPLAIGLDITSSCKVRSPSYAPCR